MTRPTSPNDRNRPARNRDGPLSPAVEQQINENLKRLYQQASDEPLPDHLLQLLDKLKHDGSSR